MIRKDAALQLTHGLLMSITCLAFFNLITLGPALKRAAILLATYTLKVLQ